MRLFFAEFLKSIQDCVDELRDNPRFSHLLSPDDDGAPAALTFSKIGAVLTLMWNGPGFEGMYITVDLVPVFEATDDLDFPGVKRSIIEYLLEKRPWGWNHSLKKHLHHERLYISQFEKVCGKKNQIEKIDVSIMLYFFKYFSFFRGKTASSS